MSAQHRHEPVRTGSAIRRAVVTSLLSALALTSVTITAAAVTLTNATPHQEAPASAASEATSPTDGSTLAPPVDVADAPLGIPDIALVAAEGPVLDNIPDGALAAYQRAAAVLAGADKQCHLEWTLLAAIGHVVSGHGTTDGSRLDQDGLMRPKLAGKPLIARNGKNVPDSDAGRLDGDARFDRPVGPLQLSPSTWSVAGVDSDGDGRRNPHDIDDATLAVAVLLCSGDDDLRDRTGLTAAVRRINDARSFVETVLTVDRAYRTQASEAADTDVVVVPGTPPAYVPPDTPVDARPTAPAGQPTDLPTVPGSDAPLPTASDPVTWIPNPDPPKPTHGPRDPGQPDLCSPEPVDPTETDATDATDATDPTDTATVEPTDTATAEPTDLSSTDTPVDTPIDEATDGKPGCPEDAADDKTQED